MNAKKFYITTTLPYVNSDPHIGFALELIQTDAIARFKRKQGFEVIFNTGTDEHGQKILESAAKQNKNPQEYVDEYSKKFEDLKNVLNISFDRFIRTTNKEHKKAAQKFWELSLKNGDIYKDKYEVKYCVGCELEKQDSDLVDGKCPLHPNTELQIVEEENYYFRFSKYQDALLKLYNDNPQFVVPSFRLNEIKQFVEGGLRDFSISRLKEKMPWGVEVPGDSEHVMYVWFDALINYISTLGWPKDKSDFDDFWPGVQTAGKDNLRQQSAMWQAMLLSAGLPTSKQVLIHGFITVDGQKMSKSVGNVVNPYEVVEKYGAESLRYYLLAVAPPFSEDIDYTEEKFANIINGDLANGIGNLVGRVTKLCELNGEKFIIELEKVKDEELESKIAKLMEDYKIDEVCRLFSAEVGKLDKDLQEKKPWEGVGDSKAYLEEVLNRILVLLDEFDFILPQTKQKVFSEIGVKEGKYLGSIKHVKGLFERV